MGFAIFISEYIAWHYGRAFTEILDLGRDFLWFGWNVFSVSLLSQSLVSPFYRIQEGYKNWTDFEALGETIVANTVSRVVGFLLRLFMLILGAFFELFILATLSIVLISWMVLPLLIPLLFFEGIYLIF